MTGANAVAIQIPLGAGSEFKGAIDLLTMEKVIWEPVGPPGGRSASSRSGKRPEVQLVRTPLSPGELKFVRPTEF